MQFHVLEKAVLDTDLIDRGQHIVAAVSGGVDSMALAHALCTLAGQLDLTVTVAHFDHCMRDDSEKDAQRVASFATARDLAFFTDRADVPAFARREGLSLEDAARRLRYAFLERIAARTGAATIATAHTRDDQIETVAMRIVRGAGVRGRAGIPLRRGRIVRPLLDVTRHDTTAYCRAHDLDYRDDPTNADTRFTRNRFRHEVLPGLRSLIPDTDAALLGIARDAGGELERIRRTTDARIDRFLVRENGGAFVLHADAFAGLDNVALQVLLGDVVDIHLPADAQLSRTHFEALMRLCRSGDGSGKSVSLPRLTVRREHDGLVFGPPVEHADAKPAVLEWNGRAGAFANRAIRVDRIRAAAGRRSDWRASAGVAFFSSDAIAYPLRVRHPEAGDRMLPHGAGGHRKLSDIFIDRKVPLRRRSNAIVVEDQSGIIWVVGVATAQRTRVTDDVEGVVRISVDHAR